MCDENDSTCPSNRVRQMARMFEALAQTESDGIAQRQQQHQFASPTQSRRSDQSLALLDSERTEVMANLGNAKRTSEPPQFADTDDDNGDDDDPQRSSASSASTGKTQSRVQRLTRSFEGFVRASQPGQLALSDGLQRQSMYLSLRGLNRSRGSWLDVKSSAASDSEHDYDREEDKGGRKMDVIECGITESESSVAEDGSFISQDTNHDVVDEVITNDYSNVSECDNTGTEDFVSNDENRIRDDKLSNDNNQNDDDARLNNESESFVTIDDNTNRLEMQCVDNSQRTSFVQPLTIGSVQIESAEIVAAGEISKHLETNQLDRIVDDIAPEDAPPPIPARRKKKHRKQNIEVIQPVPVERVIHCKPNKLLDKFYADLEKSSNQLHQNRHSIDVDYSAMTYGPKDVQCMNEFYSDLEIGIGHKSAIEVNYAAMDYAGITLKRDSHGKTDQLVDASNYDVQTNDPMNGDNGDFTDDDNEFSDSEPESETPTEAAATPTETAPSSQIDDADEAIEVAASELPTSKVPHIIDEILTNEQNYINSLGRGIDIYVSVFDTETENNPVPRSLLGQKYHLFGNIERIRDFHAKQFYPTLRSCDPADVTAICETFCRFCTDHSFYMYVLYAINSQHGDQIAERHRDYFNQRQNDYGDRLGVNSFLLQPIQRLPRYQLLLRELIKELGKRLDAVGVKEQIASCCRAEKHLQRLLDQVNSSMTINDIVDNNEINVLHQGRYRYVHEWDVYESESRRSFRGKLFMFEKGVLVTEMLSKSTLQYRGFYTRSCLGVLEMNPNEIRMFNRYPNVRQLELKNKDLNVVELWLETLKDVVKQRVQQKKFSMDSWGGSDGGGGTIRSLTRRRTMVHNDWGSLFDGSSSGASQRDSGCGADDTFSVGSGSQVVLVRNVSQTPNGIGGTSASTSNAWSSGLSGVSSSSGNSSNSQESDTKRTMWYSNVDSNSVSNGKTLDRLLNSEKHFIQILMKLQSDFLVPLAATSYRGTDGPIGQYKRAVQQLIDVHRDILYPRLVQCEQDIVAMCTIYRDAFTSAQFLDAYLLYASTCVHAYAILFGKYSDASGKSPMVDYTRWPQVHLDRTFAYMDHLMLELKDADETFVSDEFKAVVRFGVQLDQFRTRYRDNANLNAMTMETAGNYTPTYESRRSFYETYGFVEWGEACSVYGYKTRLLLLTSGLVCVRTKEVKKKEVFVSVEFHLPRSAVRTTESQRSKARIKFFASYAREIEFKVDFASEQVKLDMDKRINVFGYMA